LDAVRCLYQPIVDPGVESTRAGHGACSNSILTYSISVVLNKNRLDFFASDGGHISWKQYYHEGNSWYEEKTSAVIFCDYSDHALHT